MPPEAGEQGPHMLSGHCRRGADALPHTSGPVATDLGTQTEE